MEMDRYQVALVIKEKFVLNKIETSILEEYSQAVEERLKQLPEKFDETQCVKSWETYLKDRKLVYSTLDNI